MIEAELSTPSRTSEKALKIAEKEEAILPEFDPKTVDDLVEGSVVATSSDPAVAELVTIGKVFTDEEGRDAVNIGYIERETYCDEEIVIRTPIVKSFINRVQFDGSWVQVPYSAIREGMTPYNCPNCNRFAYVHAGITKPFSTGGCDSCGSVFTHEQLVNDGVIVELLI